MNKYNILRKFTIICRLLPVFMMACLLISFSPSQVQASSSDSSELTEANLYSNQDTGYIVMVDDRAGLFDSSELESEILPVMEEITAYANAALVTTDENDGSESDYAEDVYRRWFGTDSGTLFLIDMSNRELYIFSDGAAYRAITKSAAYTITDNVYTYASDEDYITCAALVFEQAFDRLEGRAISAPMRHISALILAIGMGLLITFIWAKYDTVTKMETNYDVMEHIKSRKNISKPEKFLMHRYIHNSKVSDSGADGYVSGSGGGSSGGGGGHSF